MEARSKTSVWQSDLTPQPQKNSSQSPWQYRHRDRHRKSSHHKQQTHRYLPPELLTQIRAESHGRAYVQKQIRKKTPMVFELYGEHIEGIISCRLTYTLAVVSVNEEVHHLEKLNIK